MSDQIPMDEENVADIAQHDGIHEVSSTLAYQRLAIVNVVYHGAEGAGDRGWVLIDAGIPGSASFIERAAEARFGEGARPAAIVMTHGHFDHVGALGTLAEKWEAPIYAHGLEMPYLDGSTSYPEPDPTVGGGLMAALSRFYPRGPIDVSRWLQPLPEDGRVPAMPGWQWIHTPGHTVGHVALWHEATRTVISGDAFISTKQESAYAVATQRPELHGPPMYYTPDWGAARRSVEALAALEPEVAITGHGPALRGAEFRAALHTLARTFNEVAVPDQGKYTDTAS